jgi:predicted aspartyl protease
MEIHHFPSSYLKYHRTIIMSSDEDNEILASDLQMALDLQYQEERNQYKRRSKRNAKPQQHQEVRFANRSALFKPVDMLFVLCELEGKAVEMLVDSGASSSVISIKSSNAVFSNDPF